MNINITQITNGFIVAIQAPRGQSAEFFPTFDAVVAHLASIASNKPDNDGENIILPNRD
jgi:hypothetical protein